MSNELLKTVFLSLKDELPDIPQDTYPSRVFSSVSYPHPSFRARCEKCKLPNDIYVSGVPYNIVLNGCVKCSTDVEYIFMFIRKFAGGRFYIAAPIDKLLLRLSLLNKDSLQPKHIYMIHSLIATCLHALEGNKLDVSINNIPIRSIVLKLAKIVNASNLPLELIV